MIWGLGLYGVLVVALLVAELHEDRRAQMLFKPLAALGFVFLALSFGALDSVYGLIILSGLIACVIGDVLLLPRNNDSVFKVGMLAFAVGHVLYSFGFIKSGLQWGELMNGKPIEILAVTVIILCASGASYPLSKAKKDMILPVFVYAVVITVMCVCALLTNNLVIIIAAFLFAASDFCVAFDRFIDRNKYWAFGITPLYFGAQALFALSVQM